MLVEKEHLWASRKPSKRALQFAFYTGVLTISERNGMLKTYELMERHFGWDKPPKPASMRETTEYLLDRALRSQGIVSLESICHTRRQQQARRPTIDRSPGSPQAVGFNRTRWRGEAGALGLPDVLETAGSPDAEMVHILSPFDPLIIQRKRARLFFDYEHRFEAYVPKEKRLFGYFALPVLVGDDIVAAIDLKTDRGTQELLMQKWTWVGNGPRKGLKRRIEEELHRFERFQLAGSIVVPAKALRATNPPP